MSSGLDNKILDDILFDYNSYDQGLIKIIGYQDYKNSDTTVKDVMSYKTWIETHQSYPVIKVEGLETFNSIKEYFNTLAVKNIHLFISQVDGHSFDWHTDDVDVFLFVVDGEKTVYFEDKNVLLSANDSVIIPKGKSHKVYSKQGTRALSVGY